MSSRTGTCVGPAPRSFAPPVLTERPVQPPDAIQEALERGQAHLSVLQKPDGHWCGELEGDTILESEYVLLLAFLGRLGDPKIGKCARYLLSKQGGDGGWNNFPDGPADVGTTVKAYLALKIAGQDPDSEPMRRARECVLERGGAEQCNSFTRFYLAALGQIPYRHCPSVPPELLLLPQWFPVNIYKMSAWTRTIVVPLSIFHAYQPVTKLPAEMGIAELFLTPPANVPYAESARFSGRLVSWSNFFRLVDRGLKVYARYVPSWLRQRAIKAAEQWMLERFEDSDGLGAIFPPMVYTILALKCLGYAEDSPEMRWAEKQLDDLIIEEGDTIRLQPCVSPVWDTALSAIALSDSGLPPEHPALCEAADWLLEREIRLPGDWSLTSPDVEPSGWAFEYHNRFYPDLDDTAMVLLALKRTDRFGDERCKAVLDRALSFLIHMQSRDGGWAAFDKDIDNRVLEDIPFADHNAMLDPSCPDITGRMLELFGQLGISRCEPYVENALRLLFEQQEPEGCWSGRWGVNYIYGTWQALLGLAAIGYDMRHPRVARAVAWLKSVQQANGAWGESCASYADRSAMGQGQPTASQTAWAVMGLIAAGEANSPEARLGIEYLLDSQNPDGSWDEPFFTGTGFPRVFYLRYHYYRLYFPLMALGRSLKAAS